MTGLMVVALAMAQSIPRTLRLFLISLLLAGLFMALGAVLLGGTSAVLVAVGSEQPRPPQYLCRVYLWIFGVGAVARLWNLAAFSLSVLAIGKKTIDMRCAAVIITILWVGPMAVTMLPYVYEAQFGNGVACVACAIWKEDHHSALCCSHHYHPLDWSHCYKYLRSVCICFWSSVCPWCGLLP